MKRKTKVVRIGSLKIGGKNPVRIKGMLKTTTDKPPALLKEAQKMADYGAEALRLAVKTAKDARLVRMLKKKIDVPFVADVHFDYRLALRAIEEGFDGIRLNPMNIKKPVSVKEVVRAAKKAGIAIRVGVNSGGFKEKFSSDQQLARRMVGAVRDYLRIFEKEQFFDTIVSLKAASVNATIAANRAFSARFDYPLHIGVTASGPFLEGIVKSSLGVGILLSEGVGDVIRISLTGPSYWEVRIAQYILQFLGIRRFFTEVISCPTCSRCEVNLVKIVDDFRKRITGLDQSSLPKRIALMGCIVNGPGEAYQADIGVAFGQKKAAIFKKDKIVGVVKSDKVLESLIQKLEKR